MVQTTIVRGIVWCVAGLICFGTVSDRAQAQVAAARSRTSWTRDRFGNALGVHVWVETAKTKRTYAFALGRQFLDLPLDVQVARLNQQFGLGEDAAAVRNVLQSVQQSLRDEAMRRQQDAIRNLQQQQQAFVRQPPITIPQPPIPQAPIMIPQGPNFPALQIPQPAIPQPPIVIPR